MARFALATETDHSANLWIITILSMLYTTAALLLRLWISFKRKTFGLEDLILTVALVAAYSQYAVVMNGLEDGMGRNLELLSEKQRSEVAEVFVSSQALYLVTVALVKLSVGLLLRRIFAQMEHKHASVLCHTFLGVTAAWGVGAILAVSVGCDGEHILPGHEASKCAAEGTRWLTITIIDCALELWVVLLSVYLVADLQMKIRGKIRASIAFAFRLGILPVSIMHYAAYTTLIIRDGRGDSFSIVLILRQTAIFYTFFSATWLVSNKFMRDFSTGGFLGSSFEPSAYGSRPRTDKKQESAVKMKRSSGKPYGMPGSEERSGSQEMIIRRDDTYTVTHHP